MLGRALDGELERASCRTWGEVDRPLAEPIGVGGAGLAAKGDCDIFAWCGATPDVHRKSALEDHVTGENFWQRDLGEQGGSRHPS